VLCSRLPRFPPITIMRIVCGLSVLVAAVALLLGARARAAEEGNDVEAASDWDIRRHPDWAGKTKGPVVFHCNVDVAKLLGIGFALQVNSTYRDECRDIEPLWAVFVQAAFRNKATAESASRPRGKRDEPTGYYLRLYECDDVLQAHTALLASMTEGSAPSSPLRCLPGVDVGDKCFTGWAKEAPTTVFFARGNVVVALHSDDSVLDITKEIDRRLCLTELAEKAAGVREEDVTFAEGRKGVPFELASEVRAKRKELSALASDGKLYVDEQDRLVLLSERPGTVHVAMSNGTFLRVRFRDKQGGAPLSASGPKVPLFKTGGRESAPSSVSRWPLAVIAGVAGLLLGFGAAALIFRRRRTRRTQGS